MLVFIFGSVAGAPTAETKVIKITDQKYDYIPETINVNLGDKVVLEVTVTDKDHGFGLDALNMTRNCQEGKRSPSDSWATTPCKNSIPPAALRGMMKVKVNTRSFEFTSGYCTHVGGRSVNEDAWYPATEADQGSKNPRGHLWAVADGMGGHSGGREASHLACRGLRAFFERALTDPKDQSATALGRHLTETVLRVDRLVRQRAASREFLNHMGTTLSCLLLADGHSIIAHVGDSRIYRWRQGHLACLTTDHTFVQEMIFEGEVDPDKAYLHPLRHLLTQAVGTAEPLCHVDCRIDPLNAGDRFLLCTDGLHNVLGSDAMAAILSSEADASSIAETLVAEALNRNAQDNTTALVVLLTDNGSVR